MSKKTINLSVIGFVDHGKSTFINTLTNQEMDTHSVERLKKITLKLGCAKFETETTEYYIIDTPGHEMLTTVMLTALSIADIPVIVISMADFDWDLSMSDKFLSLIKAYNFELVIIVASKIDTLPLDIAKEKLQKLEQRVSQFLAKDTFKILPFSFYSKKYKTLLIKYLELYVQTPKAYLKGIYCFRSFDVNMPGTNISELKGGVLGGNIKNGKLDVNTQLTLYNPDLKINLKVLKIIKDEKELDSILPSGFFTILTDLDPSLCASDNLAYSYLCEESDVQSMKKEISLKLTKTLSALDKKDTYCLIIKHIPVNAQIKLIDKVIKFNLEKALPSILFTDKVIITTKTQHGWQIKDIGYVSD